MLQKEDPRNRDLIVNINGRLVHRDQAAISPFDSAVQGGDAANSAGADDAVMLDTRGFIAETNATHIFLVEKGAVSTPTTAACPEGITRAAVLELCARHAVPHAARDLSLAELYRADEAFCTGTMGEIAWVGRVDGRTIGAGRMGPVTERLRGLFRALTASEGTLVV